MAEATKQDRTLTPIIKMIKDKDWEALRKLNKYFYSLRKDLAVTNSGCMLYDNKLVIPRNLTQFVMSILKPLLSKQNLGKLPTLEEPNEELQMDFAGPIPFRNHVDNSYILVTVDRYSRFPTAQVYKNCDTSTAIEYLEEYCKFHGIPRSLR